MLDAQGLAARRTGEGLAGSGSYGEEISELLEHCTSGRMACGGPSLELWQLVVDELTTWLTGLLTTMYLSSHGSPRMSGFERAIVAVLRKLFWDATAMRNFASLGFDEQARSLLQSITDDLASLISILDDPFFQTEFLASYQPASVALPAAN